MLAIKVVLLYLSPLTAEPKPSRIMMPGGLLCPMAQGLGIRRCVSAADLGREGRAPFFKDRTCISCGSFHDSRSLWWPCLNAVFLLPHTLQLLTLNPVLSRDPFLENWIGLGML